MRLQADEKDYDGLLHGYSDRRIGERVKPVTMGKDKGPLTPYEINVYLLYLRHVMCQSR